MLGIGGEIMPTSKTPVKKAAKAAKKVTLADLQSIVADIGIAHKELVKAHKETARQMGDLGNKFGDIAEQMLTPALVEKFEKLTFPFTQISRNAQWKKKELDLSVELDALLENGKAAMVVEVKSKLNKEYVNDFIEKMEKVRRFADLKGDTRQFYGALAAMTADDTVIKYALSKGFYLIMPSGEDVKITKPVSEKVW
jgi:arsenate reductase-like glutaredoxin family protein